MSTDQDLALSLVRDDPPFRALRTARLIPREGLGLARRAVFFTLLAWLPLAIWAAAAGRALPGGQAPAAEPLLEHFGVHARCLIAIPLLILAQGLAHGTTTRLLPWFVRSGVVPSERVPQFREVVHGVIRLRNGAIPWIVIAGLTIAWTAVGPVARDADALVWAAEGAAPATHFGFGGWWFLYVARPIYIVLALAWVWRLVLLTVLLRRATKIGLDLVPTHPDRLGGLGFVERFATMFGPVAFAFSAVLASEWAHQVLYHDLSVKALRAPAIAFLVAAVLVFLAPLAVFGPALAATKKKALLEYGALVGRHGELVRRRWILRETVGDDEILHAPEIGPVADAVSLFDAVKAMRPMPIGKPALLAVVVPALVPMVAVFALKVPIGQLLGKLLHGLV
ncbi:MAG TPA: hypothetical protein VMN82_12485 [Thermoanaerobaculia bacterium]|nr:hypothetical protein [Thermoanaerobaculia bacterium]